MSGADDLDERRGGGARDETFARAVLRRGAAQLREAPVGRGGLWRKAILIACWFVASYGALLASPGMVAYLAASVSMGFAAAAIAFNVFHDANQGSYIAFAAPGVRVWIPGGGSFGQYLTGTSFAAPFVAAAATLAMADEKDVSPDQLSRKMAAHSRHLGSPGRNPIYGYGLITAGSTCRTSAASAQ